MVIAVAVAMSTAAAQPRSLAGSARGRGGEPGGVEADLVTVDRRVRGERP